MKTRKKIKWFLLIIFLINIFPQFYIGKSIEGVVLDEQGEPLQGVVAVMEHSVETTNFHETNSSTVYNTEAVTDSNGKYYFPWWITLRRHVIGWREGSSPYVVFFKNGYSTEFVVNESKLGGLPSVYVFSNMPSNIVLKPFKPELADDHLLNWYAPSGYMRGKCSRDYLPKYTKERDEFIRSVNPIRQERGLSLLIGGEYESKYCN